MRKLAVLAIAAAMAITAMAKTTKPVHVKGYTTKAGKTVKPHDRTAPDKTKGNNWSTKGNSNPETGKKGDKKR